MMPNAGGGWLAVGHAVCRADTGSSGLLWEGSTSHRFPGLNGFLSLDGAAKVQDALPHLYGAVAIVLHLPRLSGTPTECRGPAVLSAGTLVADACELPLDHLQAWLQQLPLTAESQHKRSARCYRKCMSRVQYLMDVGLSYVTLDRQCENLERRRIATDRHDHGLGLGLGQYVVRVG
jgi:hypothetical protein